MAVTIKKIADYAGVSVGTVSRALNNDPLIAQKTREKIRNLAEELDYVPNSIGKGLQSKKSFLIGYMVANMKNSFYEDILQGIGKVACANNYGLLLAITDDNPQSEKDQLRIFREKAADGIIVSNYNEKTIPYLKKIEASGTPVVLCDIESFDKEIPVVKTNDEKATVLQAEHLIEKGHKRFAYCFHINKNSETRFNALVQILSKKGLPAPVFCKTIEELEMLCQSQEPPTAIMCYSDPMAIQIIQMLRTKGMNVPEDFAVSGFDDIETASWPEYQLTTIRQPKTELGIYAANMVFDLINNKNSEHQKIIEPELIIRNSTNMKI